MIAYIIGKVAHKDPTLTILEANGIGYEIHVSLYTSTALPKLGESFKLHTYQHIREDAHVLYGFGNPDEKELFLDLISVSGIGPNTALTMLSTLSPAELRQAILMENIKAIQSIKGIGGKTAQRVILELRDKMKKAGIMAQADMPSYRMSANPIRDEALAALVTLGIPKPAAEKSLDTILKREGEDLSVEQLIRLALK
ncbi:Holliday junction branch migration protein RuvA [Larkinella arboricola]|uniref:Holliday junction branch migration complex subunit RuvA n=1 Tax=Larkinella arboricola TaxID=643671 RepID=A0A327WQD3_LARAB|nr:Holliday junction branch migration protein RuvA [Larkinella arboricola]RAJ94156.1 Holliday junction DNA helicase subunit RuvA [Larkinella arboricola]